MAVLLVAAFPLLLLIHGAFAWLGLTLGILLLYRDNREHLLERAASVGLSVPSWVREGGLSMLNLRRSSLSNAPWNVPCGRS